jgi:hypothetical protein
MLDFDFECPNVSGITVKTLLKRSLVEGRPLSNLGAPLIEKSLDCDS